LQRGLAGLVVVLAVGANAAGLSPEFVAQRVEARAASAGNVGADFPAGFPQIGIAREVHPSQFDHRVGAEPVQLFAELPSPVLGAVAPQKPMADGCREKDGSNGLKQTVHLFVICLVAALCNASFYRAGYKDGRGSSITNPKPTALLP